MSLDYHVAFLPTSNTRRLRRAFFYHKKKIIFVIILAAYFYHDSNESNSVDSKGNTTPHTTPLAQSLKRLDNNLQENAILHKKTAKLEETKVVNSNPIQMLKAVHKSSIIEPVETQNSNDNKNPNLLTKKIKVINAVIIEAPLTPAKTTSSVSKTNLSILSSNKITKPKTKAPNNEEAKNINDLYNNGLDELLLSGDLIEELK